MFVVLCEILLIKTLLNRFNFFNTKHQNTQKRGGPPQKRQTLQSPPTFPFHYPRSFFRLCRLPSVGEPISQGWVKMPFRSLRRVSPWLSLLPCNFSSFSFSRFSLSFSGGTKTPRVGKGKRATQKWRG